MSNNLVLICRFWDNNLVFCSLKWFVKYTFSAKVWFVKSGVVKSNPVLLMVGVTYCDQQSPVLFMWNHLQPKVYKQQQIYLQTSLFLMKMVLSVPRQQQPVSRDETTVTLKNNKKMKMLHIGCMFDPNISFTSPCKGSLNN